MKIESKPILLSKLWYLMNATYACSLIPRLPLHSIHIFWFTVAASLAEVGQC